MKTRWTLMVLAVACVPILLVGCSSNGNGNGAPTADELFAEGVGYLEDSMAEIDIETPPWEWSADMEEANAFFEDALDEDPDHCGALLLAALTRLVSVLQDPELGEILDDMFPDERGGGPEDLIFRAFQKPDVYALHERLRTASRQDFHFSELQDYIEDAVIPALDYADGKLGQFEDQDCEVVLELDIETEREVMEFEIDATDVYVLHAALDVVQATFLVAVSYNVDVDEGQTLQELIDVDPNFLSLRPGDHMQSALDELVEASDHLDNGATSMAGETDPQDTDILTNTDDMGYIPLGVGAADTLAMIASDLYDALTGGVTLNPAEDSGDPMAPDVDVFVDLEEFFTDPLDPLTYYFPVHTWASPDSMVISEPFDFPDETFDGITPDMTDENWELIIEWMDEG